VVLSTALGAKREGRFMGDVFAVIILYFKVFLRVFSKRNLFLGYC